MIYQSSALGTTFESSFQTLNHGNLNHRKYERLCGGFNQDDCEAEGNECFWMVMALTIGMMMMMMMMDDGS